MRFQECAHGRDDAEQAGAAAAREQSDAEDGKGLRKPHAAAFVDLGGKQLDDRAPAYPTRLHRARHQEDDDERRRSLHDGYDRELVRDIFDANDPRHKHDHETPEDEADDQADGDGARADQQAFEHDG